MTKLAFDPQQERLDAWYDGSAVCVIAIGSCGEPQNLSDHEVLTYIGKLEECLAKSRGQDIIPQHSWAATRRNLAACRFHLPEHLQGEESIAAEAELTHYLHHNEFGLALAAAESLGEAAGAPPEFWAGLELAARSMDLSEEALLYAAKRGA